MIWNDNRMHTNSFSSQKSVLSQYVSCLKTSNTYNVEGSFISHEMFLMNYKHGFLSPIVVTLAKYSLQKC